MIFEHQQIITKNKVSEMRTSSTVYNTYENVQTQFEKVFCAIWVMVIVYMIVRPVTNNALLIRLVWIPSVIVLFVVSVMRTITRQFFLELIIPIAIIFISMLTQKDAFDQAHLLAGFCYINMFFLVYKCKSIVPSKKTFDFIFAANMVLSALFAVYSFTSIAHRVHTNNIVWYSIYYAFDLGNSNLAAMNIFSFYCILLINLAYRKHKIPIIILMIFDLYMIYGTYCRSVLITAVIVTAAFFLLGRRKIPKAIIIISELVPVLFIFIYMWMYYIMGNQSIKILDKSLFSGRQNIFLEYLSYLSGWDKVLFGNFSEAAFQNAHNITVSVLATIGIVGLVAFYSFYIRVINEINDKETSSVRNISIICILGLFLQSSMEASLFLGGFPGIMFLSTFVMVSNYTDYIPWKTRSFSSDN